MIIFFYKTLLCIVLLCSVFESNPAHAQKKTSKVSKASGVVSDASASSSADTESQPAEINADEIFKSLDYPELQVVPRATERLLTEAQYEESRRLLVHWPIILPSLATFYLGLTSDGEYKTDATKSEKDDADLYSTAATMVGGFWVAASSFISWSKPYRTGLNNTRKNKDKDKRGALYRERIAEETLEMQADTMKTLVRLAVISNLAATVAVASSHEVSDGEIAISALLAFTPWIFEHRYITTWNKHLEYKRKIYSPIASLGLKYNELAKDYTPQAVLFWTF